MKTKILSELTKKYSGLATKEYLESLAERLAEKVKEEKDIQGVIDELEASPVRIGDLQAEGDRRTAKLKKELDELKKPKEAPPNTEPPKQKEDVSAQIAELKATIEAERKHRLRQEARAALAERIKDKQIPKALLQDVEIDSISEVDDAVERLEKKAKAIREEMGTPEQAPPKKGDPQTNSRKQVVEDLKTIKPN